MVFYERDSISSNMCQNYDSKKRLLSLIFLRYGNAISCSLCIGLTRKTPVVFFFLLYQGLSPGGGGTPYIGLYGEAPPERGTFFRLQVYKRVGI